MPQIPKRIVEIVDQLKENQKKPRRQTVRTLLKWFEFERRREHVISKVQEALAFAGLTTEPDFSTAGMDDFLTFVLASEAAAHHAPVEAIPTPIAEEPSNVSDIPAAEASPKDKPLPNGPSEIDADAETNPDDYLEPDEEEETLAGHAPPQTPTTQPDVRPVTSQPADWTISTLRQKMDKKQLDLRPKYQREYVWRLKPELPSRLIESVLLDIPIPPIYFGKLLDGKLEVIDGQQRLTTLIDFVSNRFPLQKLRGLGTLNDKYYRDLSEEHQAKIDDAPIHCVVINTGERAELRYEIFERLNRGSMSLNEQEVRNCVYRGPFNDLIADLEKDASWRHVKGGGSPEPRFKEREMILRFFALANRLSYYTGNLKRFLNQYMEDHAPKTPDQLKAQAAHFRQTMQNVYAVFGDKSARLYNLGSKTNNGAWDTKFSIAALDIQASAMMGQQPAKVQAAAEQIRELFLLLLLTDVEIQTAISKQTTGTKPTNVRWSVFRSRVQQILDGTVVEPRFFSYQFRKQLYDESEECKICHNQIHSFDDSTVDHIHPYVKGGKTVPENGQLAHRTCNARKNMALPLNATTVVSVG
jgi:5-methylcytosine-specific restriction endonuclease McrA